VPKAFQQEVITALETAQIPKTMAFGAIEQEVINAAYTAFQNALQVALYLSAALALAAGVLAVITLRSGRQA
jgi:hypothetical protein